MNSDIPKIMINGIVTADVNVMDRGFQYGDGLFETMKVVNRKIPLWQKHWQRLTKGCDILSIPLPDKSALEKDIEKIINDASKAVLKLMVTRGIGGRGYAVTEKLEPEVILIRSDYPGYCNRCLLSQRPCPHYQWNWNIWLSTVDSEYHLLHDNKHFREYWGFRREDP